MNERKWYRNWRFWGALFFALILFSSCSSYYEEASTPTIEYDENYIVIRDDRLSEKVPYKGLAEELVEQTSLGPADIIYASNNMMIYYFWLTDDGQDVAYAVRVISSTGERSSVRNIKDKDDYFKWPDPFNLPEPRSAAPEQQAIPLGQQPAEEIDRTSPTIGDGQPNPYLYDTPEDYADNESWWFYDTGHEDPWNYAYEYWEDIRR